MFPMDAGEFITEVSFDVLDLLFAIFRIKDPIE
jgi:hypothetical protein